MSAPASPSPTPWRPDGEGWEAYQLGRVIGLHTWEITAPGRGPCLATDGWWEQQDRSALVYARPIPEPPIKVGDTVTCPGEWDVRLPVVFQSASESVVETSDGDLLVRSTVNLRRSERPAPPALTTHRCPS